MTRQTEVQKLLRTELSKRVAKNPRYSLRAFAKASGVSHTVLSLVLTGKRPLSRKAAAKLNAFLELGPEDRRTLLKRDDGISVAPSAEFRRISLDTFAVISDWYHYAILSLLELPGALFEAWWIARALAIPENDAHLAMDRLQRVGLVARGEDGSYRQSGAPLKIENTVSTSATRLFHRQLLEKALESLDRTAPEERDFSSMTLAIDSAQIPYAQKRIQAFRRELAAELEARSQGNPNAVYELTVQLFPVSTAQSSVTPTQKASRLPRPASSRATGSQAAS